GPGARRAVLHPSGRQKLPGKTCRRGRVGKVSLTPSRLARQAGKNCRGIAQGTRALRPGQRGLMTTTSETADGLGAAGRGGRKRLLVIGAVALGLLVAGGGGAA